MFDAGSRLASILNEKSNVQSISCYSKLFLNLMRTVYDEVQMETRLNKFKFSGSSNTRPNTSRDQSTAKIPAKVIPPSPVPDKMNVEGLKSEILLSLKADISTVLKSELKNALADDFDFLKNELKEVKIEIINSTAALKHEIDQAKVSIKEVEGGLSVWSEEVVTLQKTVSGMKTEIAELKAKCEDLEGRSRRCNIRIISVPETPDSSTAASVSKLLTEVLQLDKEPLIDRAHRSLGPKKPGGKPRAIVAKLHYYQECAQILRRARIRGQLRFNGESITIFPDYTTAVAKARAAFTEVRKLLRDREGVRYGILFQARLRVTFRGEDREFTDSDKAMTYVKKNIIPPTEAGESL